MPTIADELKFIAHYDYNAKQEVAEKFKEYNFQKLVDLGALFKEVEQEHLEKKQNHIDMLFAFFNVYKGLVSLNDF